MPAMSYTPKPTNDASTLTPGWHPAVLLAILDEATPEGWIMAQRNPRMYRWKFAVYTTPQNLPHETPERQSAVSSQAFTPKGRNPASKAYTWTTELLGRVIMPGESVDLDPLLPLPCRVKIERREQYANIVDLERWDEGKPLLTDAVKRTLAHLDEEAPPVTTPPPVQTPPAGTVTQPTLPGTPPAQSRW